MSDISQLKIQAFFDEPTHTVSYLVWDGASLQGAAIEDQSAPARFGAAEDLLGHGESDGAKAIAFANRAGFGGRFDLALGKQCSGGELQVHAQIAKSDEKCGGKIVGDAKTWHAIRASELGDDLGGADPVGVAALGAVAPHLERKHFVECARFLDTSEFQGALNGDAAFSSSEGDERIVNFDAAEVELVGIRGVSVEERGKFRGHEVHYMSVESARNRQSDEREPACHGSAGASSWQKCPRRKTTPQPDPVRRGWGW
jgi:hypothetical protein